MRHLRPCWLWKVAQNAELLNCFRADLRYRLPECSESMMDCPCQVAATPHSSKRNRRQVHLTIASSRGAAGPFPAATSRCFWQLHGSYLHPSSRPPRRQASRTAPQLPLVWLALPHGQTSDSDFHDPASPQPWPPSMAVALQAQEPALLPSSSSLDKQGEWIRSQANVAKCCWNESMRQAMHKGSKGHSRPADQEGPGGLSPIAGLDPTRPDPSPLNRIRDDLCPRDQTRAPGPGPGRERRPDAGV